MRPEREIVITGVGVVSPVGMGGDAFYSALLAGRSGIRRLHLFDHPGLPVPIGGQVTDFDGKSYVRPRKSMKVMSRDIQFAFAAAEMASAQAGLTEHRVDPERMGVVFGADMILCDLDEIVLPYRNCLVDGQFDFSRWGGSAMSDLFPLWMLKYLPNMSACHIGIAQDARGPNNTITMGCVSSVTAISEAARVLERGWADVMLAGGTSSRVHPMTVFREAVVDAGRADEDPATVCRPFDAARRGAVNGEGSAVFVLETATHAAARGTKPLARILGYAAAYEPAHNGTPLTGRSIRRALQGALRAADLSVGDVGYVNAHGLSTIEDDRREAAAICDVLGDVPVTAPKSYFGNLGAAAGAMEMAASVLGFATGEVPAVRNYETPDPTCPVNAIRGQPAKFDKRVAVKLNHAPLGQAVAMVIAAP